jgi:hypothetical protein
MRFFYKKDPPASSEAGQEVLRPLVYEIPAEMAEANEILRTRRGVQLASGGKREWWSRHAGIYSNIRTASSDVARVTPSRQT